MKPYKIALLTGTHQHRWPDDGSGICEKCHKEHVPHVYSSSNPGICSVCGAVGKCLHDSCYAFSELYHICNKCYSKLEHTKVLVAEDTVCWKCSVCGRVQSPHTFAEGGCSVCGWECPHIYLTNQEENGHKCNMCGMLFSHNLAVVGTPAICRQCECGYVIGHDGITRLGQSCSVCGYMHDSHVWYSGKCSVCGTVCSHDEINEFGNCTVCGMKMNRPNGIYGYGASGGYDGSYILDQSGEHFDTYNGFVWSYGRWIANGYKLFLFDVRENPVQFGGDYAYKITGYVFTKASSVNVSPALLSANGVRNLKLAQYNLDGSLREADTTGYTAADCIFKSTSMNVNPTWSP